MIYLDYNATAPLRDCAREAATQAMCLYGNPSSVHGFGRLVRQKIEAARKTIADILDVESRRVIFTSGATEANNMALRFFPGDVFVGSTEHDSVRVVRDDACIIACDIHGLMSCTSLENHLKASTSSLKLVSYMAANNETGVISDLESVQEICMRYGAILHSDMSQAFGRTALDMKKVHMASFSGHKIGALTGVGCLIVDEKLPLFQLMQGGGQERSYRAGTENLSGILSFAAAASDMQNDDWTSTSQKRDWIEAQVGAENVMIRDVARLPNTALIRMSGVKNETQVMNFDLAGIALSAGSACSSGKIKTSHVLQAMNIPEADMSCTVRVSLGPLSSQEDVSCFVHVWREMTNKQQINS